MDTGYPRFAYFGHHKCATQWITAILADICAATHLRMFEVSRVEEWDFPDLRALVRCFRPDVLVYSNAEIRQARLLPPGRGFHVIRDPRDLIVSAYFSHLHSHSVETWPGLREHRRRLQATDPSTGLLHEMEFSRRVLTDLHDWAYDQRDVLELRMEDLILSPVDHVARVVEHLGLTHLPSSTHRERVVGLAGILCGRARRLARRQLGRAWHPAPGTGGSPAASSSRGPDPYRFYPLDRVWRHGLQTRRLQVEDLQDMVERHSFARKTGGRARGVEDVHNHYRKGVVGDWRNHFQPLHVEYFKRHYNDVLLKLGYETDPHWS